MQEYTDLSTSRSHTEYNNLAALSLSLTYFPPRWLIQRAISHAPKFIAM